MSDPVDITIARVKSLGEGHVVKIECRDGPRVLVTIEMAERDFVDATLGGAIVNAGITLKALP